MSLEAGRPPAGPAPRSCLRPRPAAPCSPRGLELHLASLPCCSCTCHPFGFSSLQNHLLNWTILKLHFFSCCSHKSAFNPFRLRLCTDRSLRKIDEGQTCNYEEIPEAPSIWGAVSAAVLTGTWRRCLPAAPLLPCPLCPLLPTAPLF